MMGRGRAEFVTGVEFRSQGPGCTRKRKSRSSPLRLLHRRQTRRRGWHTGLSSSTPAVETPPEVDGATPVPQRVAQSCLPRHPDTSIAHHVRHSVTHRPISDPTPTRAPGSPLAAGLGRHRRVSGSTTRVPSLTIVDGPSRTRRVSRPGPLPPGEPLATRPRSRVRESLAPV